MRNVWGNGLLNFTGGPWCRRRAPQAPCAPMLLSSYYGERCPRSPGVGCGPTGQGHGATSGRPPTPPVSLFKSFPTHRPTPRPWRRRTVRALHSAPPHNIVLYHSCSSGVTRRRDHRPWRQGACSSQCVFPTQHFCPPPLPLPRSFPKAPP